MELIADILLAAGAIGAGFYCFILGRRLKKFNSLEQGVGGAVAVLSAQVEDLRKTLTAAQQTAAASAETLSDMTYRAEEMAKRLELQMASMHDIPEVATPKPQAQPTAEPQYPSEPMFTRRAAGGR
ncbi:hypothetical protein [uncultured Tateyamaria sp.]|uniref:hypothetical protein n=1 Tax=uncultured Tateyamaria sp. TaxID=455651 RepID=UPI0026198ABE|nr:hypothetical protein [uncultured Tateyamaria sp.]